MAVQGRHRVHRKPGRPLLVRLARGARRSTLYTAALLIAITSAAPVAWTISTSLKQGYAVFSLPPELVPNPVFWQNYLSVWQGWGGLLPTTLWLRNSLLLTGTNIVGEILFSAIAGFGFARFRSRFRDPMFVVMLGSAVIPFMVKLLPQYHMFRDLHWTNTYLPLILPQWFGGMYLTFLFCQYFVTIPRSLDESAFVDGASNLQIFFRIILPLSKPILATAAILVFRSNWDKFLEPFIYLHSIEKYTLAIGLRMVRDASYAGLSKQPLIAAYAMCMSMPMIVFVFAAQRGFVRGIQLSVAKE